MNATVRWTVAVTSANTGHYIYFIPSLRRDKMQIESLPVYPSLFLRIMEKPLLSATTRAVFLYRSTDI